MSKKKLNTTVVLNELSGQSVYFQKESPKEQSHSLDIPSKNNSDNKDGIKQPSNHEPMTPRAHDTMGSRVHDTTIETIRKAVKQIGKEGATHRFTSKEKRDIADLIYTYKRQGIRTSENEITRIAINFVVQDRNENGENSILDQVLKVLNE
jgi:hypothetical protein